MTERFVETSRGGLVNLRHVVRIEERIRWKDEDGKRRHAGTDYFAILPSGERLELPEELDELAKGEEVILPSPPDLFMLVLWWDIDDFVAMERAPIVAWRVGAHGYPIALAAGQPGAGSWAAGGGELQLIELPGGTYVENGFEGSTFADLDSARCYVTKQQERYAAEQDRKRAEAAG